MTDLSPTAGFPTTQESSPSSATGSDASMKDKATTAAEAAKDAAGDVAGTATDKAKDVVQETKRQTRDLVGQARGQLSSQLGDQHQNLAKNVRSLADELGRMSDNGGQSGLATDLVGQAGDRARGLADWLENRQPGDVLDEVRRFARQRPGTFLVGALVAGVAVGRLTRGAVAAHSDSDAHPQSTTGADAAAGSPADASGYSSPPVHQGLPTAEGGSAYGGVSAEITSAMPTMTPPATPPRPVEPSLLPGTPAAFGEDRS